MLCEGHRGVVRRRALHAVLAAIMAFSPASAVGSTPSAFAAMCERAIVHGARLGGVPEPVLAAIALTETGRWQDGRLRPWPWAVNREGQGYWFDSRDEALSFARRSVAEGRHSFDMGCFQINYHWHGHHFDSLEAMADPETGALYAARFLRALYAELGNWSAAAGAYHSRTPEFAARYRARFDRILAGLGGGSLAAFAAAEPAGEEAPRGTIRRVQGPRVITIAPAASTEAEADGRIIRVITEPSEAAVAGRRL